MAEWILCCLRWRYSAVDRNSNRERLLNLPEVQLDTTHMGMRLIATINITAGHMRYCSAYGNLPHRHTACGKYRKLPKSTENYSILS